MYQLVESPFPCDFNLRVPPHAFSGVVVVNQTRGADTKCLKPLCQ